MPVGDRSVTNEDLSKTTMRRSRPVTLFACCLFVSFVAIAAIAATPGGASIVTPVSDSPAQTTTALQENDTTPPRLHSGTKINKTAVSILIVDDTRVNISSISADDFLTDTGDIAGIDAEPAETNATVELYLEEPIDEDELVVGLRPSTTIQDTAGNVIDTENDSTSVTVTGMDGVPPNILGVAVGDAAGQPARIEFVFDEKLSTLEVAISGPVDTQLDIDDFENVEGNTYVAEFVPDEEGEYTAELLRVTDTAGNTAEPSVRRSFEADLTKPTAVMGIDFGQSSRTAVAFDANASTGNALEYRWEFGDGTTANGPHVTHEYAPGIYTVTLEVTDGFGNSDSVTLELDLTDGLDPGDSNGTEDGSSVVVERSGATPGESAVVSILEATAGNPVDVGSTDGTGTSIIEDDAYSLDGLVVVPEGNATFSLALSTVEATSVASSEQVSDEAVGGLTAITAVADDQISSVSFSFTVSTDVLDERDVDPENFELRRMHDDRWRSLETTFVEKTDDGYRYRAESPGFSRFALVATDVPTDDGPDDNETGDPSFSVVDTRLSRTTVSVGDSVRVETTVENTGDGTGDFTAQLGVNGSSIDTVTLSGIEPGESETVTFTHQFDQPGTATVTVNDETAGSVTVETADDSGNETTGNQTGDDSNGTDNETSGTDDQLNETQQNNFAVTDVVLNESSIAPGGAVTIEANVTNTGEEQADFVAQLEVDGTVVETRDVPKVPGNATLPVRFTRSFNETGTYNISVSGTQSQPPLTVEEGGGGIFSILPLGFLPLGLLRPLVLFVVFPLLVVYGALKGVAIYLGY